MNVYPHYQLLLFPEFPGMIPKKILYLPLEYFQLLSDPEDQIFSSLFRTFWSNDSSIIQEAFTSMDCACLLYWHECEHSCYHYGCCQNSWNSKFIQQK